jgi:hypothetical protein
MYLKLDETLRRNRRVWRPQRGTTLTLIAPWHRYGLSGMRGFGSEGN